MNVSELLKLNEEVIKAWNRHDTEKFLSYCDEKIVWKDVANADPYKGKEGARKFFTAWLNGFPDLSLKILNTIVSTDNIAVEIEFTGKNTGPLKMGDMPEMPATNKKVVNSKGTYFAWAKDGKFTEVHTYPDLAGVMAQLGLLQEVHV